MRRRAQPRKGGPKPVEPYPGSAVGIRADLARSSQPARIRYTLATLKGLALHTTNARADVHLALVYVAFVGVYGCAAMARGSALLSVQRVYIITAIGSGNEANCMQRRLLHYSIYNL